MTGQIILMLYGMVFLLLVPADAVFVSAFLMTAIYIGLWNLKIPYRIRQILPWVWLLLCLGGAGVIHLCCCGMLQYA